MFLIIEKIYDGWSIYKSLIYLYIPPFSILLNQLLLHRNVIMLFINCRYMTVGLYIKV